MSMWGASTATAPGYTETPCSPVYSYAEPPRPRVVSKGVTKKRYCFVALNVTLIVFGAITIIAGLRTISIKCAAAISPLSYGWLLLVNGTMGILAVIWKDRHVFIIYFWCSSSLIFIELVAIVAMLCLPFSMSEKQWDDRAHSLMMEYNGNRAECVNDRVDGVQNIFECCGYNGPSDWDAHRNYSCTIPGGSCSTPRSCCTNWEYGDDNYYNTVRLFKCNTRRYRY